MRIAFVDFIYHYDASRPDQDEPLGGTTSAICFLARELVKKGIECEFFNRIASPIASHGITSFPLQSLGEAIERGGHDAYIFCGRWTAELVGLVRANTKAPLIAWMHESVFTPPMTPALADFDGVVFVSEWQMRANQNSAQPHWKQAVIRNAMNPLAELPFPQNDEILPAKSSPPTLLFAGSFARGAFHIQPIVEKIRAVRQDFSVEMFCNLDPSRDAEKDAQYIAWLRSQPNISHLGMVGQQELIRRMRQASILLSPNPWPETSCIAMIEALASGMTVITTNRAALTETASGFATHIPIADNDDKTRFDMPIDHDAFAATVLEAMKNTEILPHETEARLRKQVNFFRTHYVWKNRADQWLDFINDLSAP